MVIVHIYIYIYSTLVITLIFIIRKAVILIFTHILPQNLGEYVAYANGEQVQSAVAIVTPLIKFHALFLLEMLGWTVL